MNENNRKGDWMQTFTGKQFWPLDPRKEEVDIRDIAHGLSNMCRYGGHSNRFFSVGQHSILVAEVLPDQYRLQGLMHDASEAYLCDIPRPIKKYLTNYKEIEDRLMEVISSKFNFTWPMNKKVKIADDRMCLTEKLWIMKHSPDEWHTVDGGVYEGLVIEPWSPEFTEAKFLEIFYDETRQVQFTGIDLMNQAAKQLT